MSDFLYEDPFTSMAQPDNDFQIDLASLEDLPELEMDFDLGLYQDEISDTKALKEQVENMASTHKQLQEKVSYLESRLSVLEDAESR